MFFIYLNPQYSYAFFFFFYILSTEQLGSPSGFRRTCKLIWCRYATYVHKYDATPSPATPRPASTPGPPLIKVKSTLMQPRLPSVILCVLPNTCDMCDQACNPRIYPNVPLMTSLPYSSVRAVQFVTSLMFSNACDRRVSSSS